MQPQETERLHVLLGYACNNNCSFCMEEDRVTRGRRIREVPPDSVRALMERHRGALEVMFTSGEPLMNRHFLSYVRWARELGYATVGVITNGRLFAYPRYAERALVAGLNHIVVSVHGKDERHHDRQTRTVSSYAQTIVGLRALAALKPRHAFRLHTSTVVNRRNYQDLYDIWLSLQGLSIDQFVFNVIQPVGRAESAFDKLVPRFTDVARAFEEFLARVGARPRQVFLLDLPYCLTEALPDDVRGFVERYQYYEHEDGLDDALECGHDETGLPAAPDYVVPTDEGGETGAELHRLTRKALDESRKSKRAECAACRHEGICDGVWNRYLDAFGWDEFLPVLGPAGREGSAEPDSAAPNGREP